MQAISQELHRTAEKHVLRIRDKRLSKYKRTHDQADSQYQVGQAFFEKETKQLRPFTTSTSKGTQGPLVSSISGELSVSPVVPPSDGITSRQTPGAENLTLDHNILEPPASSVAFPETFSELLNRNGVPSGMLTEDVPSFNVLPFSKLRHRSTCRLLHRITQTTQCPSQKATGVSYVAGSISYNPIPSFLS